MEVDPVQSNRDVSRRCRELIDHVHELGAALRSGVLQRMAEAEAGVTARRFDAVGSSGTHTDATATMALREGDFAVRHRAELAGAVVSALLAVDRALTLARLYPVPHIADAADRAALARLNGKFEPGCDNCARTRREDGMPRWVPIDSRLTDATTVNGRLERPQLLCVWCVEKVRAWGRVPTVDELDRHHRGERVPWPADVERPA
jgi:hypothetical protein